MRSVVNLLKTNSATNIWGRGTGKSFYIAWLMHTIKSTMPRSAWAIVGQSYRQILTRTLPSTISALEYIGYRKDKDYFIRKKPPASWKWQTPFEPPVDYDHFFIFPNGTGFHLVSQDGGGGSSRGLNVDGIICDESLLINKEKFDKESSATNRGNLRHFRHVPIHHGVFHFSSMPYGADSKWLLDHGSYYKDDGHDYKPVKEKLVELELEFVKNKDVEYRMELWTKIVKAKKLLKYYAKDGRIYTEADVFDNIQNLGIKYIEQQYQDLTTLMFLVEILNWYPDKIDDGFYPELSRERHGYKAANNNDYLSSLEEGDAAFSNPDSRMDADCVPTQPLRIAVDWGAKINCMTIGQNFRSINTLRIIKELYVKSPKILTDLAAEFCTYYRYHNNKSIIFIYDHTGNSKQANSNMTYSEQFAQILKRNGWTVTFATRGAATTHANKYLLTNKIFKSTDSTLPRIEFNLDNCPATMLSMSRAPVEEVRGEIKKNKKSENNNLIPAEEATHLSDTVDLHIVSLFSDLLRPIVPFTGIVHS